MSNIIDTKAGIQGYGLAVLRTRLKLEGQGLRGRGKSALSVAKGMGYKGSREAIIAAITAQLA